MLTNVTKSVIYATRQVVLRHPNSFPCSAWRKKVLRVELDPDTGDESTMSGLPTMGGMGVLKSDDELKLMNRPVLPPGWFSVAEMPLVLPGRRR